MQAVHKKFGAAFNKDSDHHVLFRSSANTRESVYESTTHTTNGTKFSIQGMDPELLLDRRLMISVPVQVVIGNGDVTVNDIVTNFAPHQLPLHRCMKDLSISINGARENVDPSVYAAPLAKYISKEMLDEFGSPTQDDLYASKDLQELKVGLYDNPLSTNPGSRAEFVPRSFVKTGGAGVTIIYDLVTTLIHPFTSLGEDVLAKVTKLDVDIAWSNLKNMFYMDVGGITGASEAGSSVTFVANEKAKLMLRTYQPTVALPERVPLKLNRFTLNSQTISDMGALKAEKDATINNLEYGTVPERLFIWASPTNPTDVLDGQFNPMLCLQSLSIDVSSGASGNLTNANVYQLHEMSVRNGSRQTFQQFDLLQGSVACIDIEKGDLGGLIPGVDTPLRLTLKAKWKNKLFKTFNNNSLLIDQSGAGASGITDWTMHVLAVSRVDVLAGANSATVTQGVDMALAQDIMENSELHVANHGKHHGGFLGLATLGSMAIPMIGGLLSKVVGGIAGSLANKAVSSVGQRVNRRKGGAAELLS